MKVNCKIILINFNSPGILLELMSEKNAVHREAHREIVELTWSLQAQRNGLLGLNSDPRNTGRTQGVYVNVMDPWAPGAGVKVDEDQLLPKVGWWQENVFKGQKVSLMTAL